MCGILALFGAPDANGDLRANLLALSKVGLKLSVHTPSMASTSSYNAFSVSIQKRPGPMSILPFWIGSRI
jgi:hypothetical protein